MTILPTDLTIGELTGKTSTHIDFDRLATPVHRQIVAPFRALQRDARAAGFDLQPVSGFRDYSRQLAIWNGKAAGQRPVLNDSGEPLNIADCSDAELVRAILRWSALPGASRHHWGTEVDVIDAGTIDAAYQVQLTPEEVADDGVFGPMHRWLDEVIARGDSHGFVRPYALDQGGIAPERWHLSYAPLAARYHAALKPELLGAAVLADESLALRETVQGIWGEIYARFVDVDRACYATADAVLSTPDLKG